MGSDRPEKLTAEELAAPITKANFWRRVRHYVWFDLGAPDELPTIRPGTEDWNAWQEYFERHLQWVPAVMLEALLNRFEAMTMPTPRPEQFDLSFIDEPGYRLRHEWIGRHPVDKPREPLRRPPPQPYRLNNVFVAPDNPIYPQMVGRYDRGDGGKVGELRGIAGLWVPLAWMPERRGNRLGRFAAASLAGAAREAILGQKEAAE